MKNCRVNSRKNALKRRKLQKYNRTKHFFKRITAIFSEITFHLQ